LLTERDTIVQDDYYSTTTKYVGLAGFTILVWDHIITFSDEVEYIWKGRKGIAVYLFLLNRYLIPLSFIVNLWAYFRTTWSLESCRHFVRYEGSMTMIGISIVDLMMFMRIRALYARMLSIQALVLAIFLTFFGVNAYLLTRGVPVYHVAYPLVDSCTMIFDQKVSLAFASSTAWLPLIYDTVVVSLTVYRTASSVLSRNTNELFRVLLREGLLYYSVICTITMILTIMILHADPSIRNITAQLHLLLTVAMMSKISIHLKRFAHRPNGIIYHYMTPTRFGHRRFVSSSPLLSLAPPTYATPAARPTHVKFVPSARPTSENEPCFAMDTFSTGTVAREFDAQHLHELVEPEVSVSSYHTAKG